MLQQHKLTELGVLPTAVLSALLLVAILPARAQTETPLYSFTGGDDGAYPQSGLTPDGKGNFYGTAVKGGVGYGTVFEVSPDGNGGWRETVLYSFKCGADGCAPDAGVIFDSLGNIYGTAPGGGADWLGVVFELSPVAGGWAETVLYSFKGGIDGANPISGLIFDKEGKLYGTTLYGGVDGSGTVYELRPSREGWTERVIYTSESAIFQNGGVTMDTVGNIFGATYSTVFKLSPDGQAGWTPTVIHTFTGPPEDGYEGGITPVLDEEGNVYGATFSGGTSNCGTVYRLSPGKNGLWRENILHSFRCSRSGSKDGNGPAAGIVFDTAGNIYGTTSLGGKSGDGVVFELKAAGGKRSYKERVLWSFNGLDGSNPSTGGLVLDSVGNLFGVTGGGGQYGYGVVFEVTP